MEELPRMRIYGCEEEDVMTLFRAGGGRSMSMSMSMSIAAGADDDVLNLYGTNGTATARSSSHNVVDDVATDDDEEGEIEKAVALRRRRQKQQQGVADAAAAATGIDAVLVARDNQEVAQQNAEAAQRSAEAAREHAELAAPRVVAEVAARHRHDAADNDDAAGTDHRAHASESEIAHVIAEVAGLRAGVARRGDESIIISFAVALLAALFMPALLYYILPLALK